MSRVMLTRFLTPEGEPLTDWQTPLKRSSPIDRVDLLFNVARKCMTYLSTPASLLVSICFYPIDAFFMSGWTQCLSRLFFFVINSQRDQHLANTWINNNIHSP